MSIRASASARSIIGLLVLLLLAPAFAPASALGRDRVVRPGDLDEGVPRDAVRLEGAWRVEEGAQLALVPQGDALARATIVLEGIEVFGFHVEPGAGKAVFLVDNVVVRAFTQPEAFDIALTPERHEISWTFERAGGAGRLVLDGAVAVRPLEVLRFPAWLSPCGGLLSVPLLYALPIDADVLAATWDGEPVELKTTSLRDRDRLQTRAVIHLPPQPPGEHRLTLDWVEETVVDVVVDVAMTAGVGTSPHGWVYDRTPTLSLVIHRCLPVASVELTVDGKRVETMSAWYGVAYDFPEPLAFGEEHAYEFRVRLKDGREIVARGNIIEGLDVVEFDLKPGRLLFIADGPQVDFGSPDRALDLPIVHAQARKDLPWTAFTQRYPAGAHVVAEYAPMELVCTTQGSGKVCSPYGGGAPGYWETAGFLAPATVTGSGERTLIAAGQAAAASHFSRVKVPLPAVAVDADLRAELTAAAAKLGSVTEVASGT